MQLLFRKKIVVTALVIAVLGVGVLVFVSLQKEATELSQDQEEILVAKQEVIGASVEGRKIEAYTYGNGETQLLFVGGMHGGYEWNSILLSYQFMDYLEENPDIVPANLSVTVIPSINPDGLYKVVGRDGRFAIKDVPKNEEATVPGRFNANDVDLNRNFDCKWQPESMWRGNVVSAGSGVFSEPEALALRDFVLEHEPDAVIFWHSQANAVYASECEEGILPETLDIMNAYSNASGYKAVDSFDAYPITGDAEGWLASINIPAITVELSTHEDIEWLLNLNGIGALFAMYSN